MSKKKSNHSFTQTSKNENTWDLAISDAEKQIQEAKTKIAHLKRAIKSFEILRDTGAPFPAENTSRNEVQA